MKNVVLHIGRHKTGTSSLQRNLYQNASRLWECGYYYPSRHIRGYGHHLLAEDLRKGMMRELTRAQRTQRIRDSKAKVKALSDSGASSLILSSEAFQNADPAVIRDVFDPEYFEVHVVCYVREQASYLASAYNQKVHATWYDRPIEEFFENQFAADYWKFASSWAAYFPSLSFRVFDRSWLHNGNITDDFYETILGLKFLEWHRGADGNPSLTRRVLELKKRLNTQVNTGQRILKCKYPLLYDRCAELALADTSGVFRLDGDLVRRVENRFESSNKRFLRKYVGGGAFPKYMTGDRPEPEIAISGDEVEETFGDIACLKSGVDE